MPGIGRGRSAVAFRRARSAGVGASVLGVVLGAWACAGGPPPPPPEPVDAEAIAQNARLATRLEQPARIVFDWSLNEAGSRTSGRGVVRMEPPYKARLDLFTEQGETVLRAALVDDVLRLPRGVESQDIVPQPHLLWSALGVFRPGTLALLMGGERLEDGEVRLRYSYGAGEELQYRLRGGRVRVAELHRGGDAVERVSVEASSDHRFPRQTVYRNLGAFRELTLTLDAYEHVDVFPPDIWLDTR